MSPLLLLFPEITFMYSSGFSISTLASIFLLHTAPEAAGRLSASGVRRSSCFGGNYGMCHSGSSEPHLLISISKNPAHYWMHDSTRWLCPILSQSMSLQLPLTREGSYVSLLGLLSSSSQISSENTHFRSFLCLLTLQLYYLTLSSSLTHSLHKSCYPLKNSSHCCRLLPDERSAAMVLGIASHSEGPARENSRHCTQPNLKSSDDIYRPT